LCAEGVRRGARGARRRLLCKYRRSLRGWLLCVVKNRVRRSRKPTFFRGSRKAERIKSGLPVWKDERGNGLLGDFLVVGQAIVVRKMRQISTHIAERNRSDT
jgi:hypothetical protein